ncbi:FUSC family protein [Dyella caseinilytica]|uniref:FUSC family protein n=1 Tax=Dyella caseinilytica TaxID=1849581 RepID=A0ABX7GZJ7_9GAMM|nr:FUSC family protein [Dyella caseinilytica]QRN55453.1 FUSC family protein [Dyella caseinilytica]GGA01814.1 fusaric acid resistance protein [Dyella caseinilytica]
MSVTEAKAVASSRRELIAATLREETATWLFVLKSLLAFYITGWLAMRLELPQPSTAMLTTIIVANRQTGMVLAKSFYRGIGTLVGALAGFLIVALFPQQRVLFLTAMSLWIGLCAGGATLYRNFKAYAFVLAGYTAAIVALPVIDHPLEVFNSAVFRMSEVLLGLGVSGAVHDLIFPRRIRDDMRRLARTQFANFIDFVQRAMAGKVARPDIENAHLRFVRDAVTLEDLRSSVIFEDPEARARSGHIMMLNQRFMAASTSLQSLHHLINRLKRKGHDVPANALIELYGPISEALDAPIEAGAAARVLLPRLQSARKAMDLHRPALRAGLRSDSDLLDFDTGVTLLDQFAGELYDYVDISSALQAPTLVGPAERVHFERGNDYIGSTIAFVRTTLAMGALSLFWIGSAWPYGSSAMLIATVFAGLFAAAPNPSLAVRETFTGYLLGMAVCFVCLFYVLPEMDGFSLLIAGSAPFLMVGLALMAAPATTRVGVGYCMGFAYILGTKNQMVFDVMNFLNDMIAQLIGVASAGISFVIIPPAIGSIWFIHRQLDRLRRQVGSAATAPLTGLRSRFESMNHDLFGQIVAQTERGSQASRNLLAWALSVHEMGRTLIELRNQMANRSLPGEVHGAITRAIDALARLYEQPSVVSYEHALHALSAATVMTSRDPSMHTLMDYLHLLRLALVDDQSVLAEYMRSKTLANGATHAA